MIINYNINQLDDTFTLDNQELDIYYQHTMRGIELHTYHKGNKFTIHYMDTFDDYYDEYELLRDLHMQFIERLKIRIENDKRKDIYG
jgi:hypothetical protein